jgi:predicted cupin superfamily sugar epimerase
LDADTVIRRLALAPHPEGGHYREIFRDPGEGAGRGQLTSILYLLRAGEHSAWHRVVDAVELWSFHAGATLRLDISTDGASTTSHRLGLDLDSGAVLQLAVPRSAWQSAETLGAWTLAGCAVAPAFDFARFELAPKGWRPGSP